MTFAIVHNNNIYVRNYIKDGNIYLNSSAAFSNQRIQAIIPLYMMPWTLVALSLK